MDRRKVIAEIRSWLWVILVVLALREWVVQAYHIPSSSMEDTLLVGDFLLAAKFVYGLSIPFTDTRVLPLKKPHRQEIVIFSSITERGKDLVKRCIALGGDTVQIINKVVYVNGKRLDEPYVVHRDPNIYPPLMPTKTELERQIFQENWLNGEFMEGVNGGLPSVRDNFGPVVVPEGYIFVMGDNRDNSFDSRFFGPVPLSKLKGMPLIIYFSWDPYRPLWPIWKKIRWSRLFKLVFLM